MCLVWWQRDKSLITHIKLETLKEFLHFPRGYVDIPTLHTHVVSRKLLHHPPSVHLTSTIFRLRRERKED